MNRNPERVPLDQEEQWYEDHAEEFITEPENLRNRLIEAARNGSQKTEHMNIRVTRHDMENLKPAAAREGIPYQSLVSSILHKYTTGALVDINEARELFSL